MFVSRPERVSPWTLVVLPERTAEIRQTKRRPKRPTTTTQTRSLRSQRDAYSTRRSKRRKTPSFTLDPCGSTTGKQLTLLRTKKLIFFSPIKLGRSLTENDVRGVLSPTITPRRSSDWFFFFFLVFRVTLLPPPWNGLDLHVGVPSVSTRFCLRPVRGFRPPAVVPGRSF